jgi:hypothetical protein
MARAIKMRKKIETMIVESVNITSHTKIVGIDIKIIGAPGGLDANWSAGSDAQFKTAGIATERVIRERVAFLQLQYDIGEYHRRSDVACGAVKLQRSTNLAWH